MSQSVIGALRVNLGLDSAQFERGLGSASKRLADMRGRFAAFSTRRRHSRIDDSECTPRSHT